MTEEQRRRGTQGKPMIYGKTPESRRYWQIPEEPKKNAVQKESQSTERMMNTTPNLKLHKKTAEQKPKAETKKQMQKISTRPAAKKRIPEGKREREHSNERRLQILWAVFGILAALLVAAIIYEIVLGNGTKLPGSQRITQPTRQEQNKETNAVTVRKAETDDSEAVKDTEKQTEAQQTELVQTEADAESDGAGAGGS